ncbi:hypothetical protein YP76_04695 [Sphingobium chungbukense]|uniref:DUF551 domain-containing protein n=2 Tax=Sphingobium chungbukense TaxID=56193 RepID=A0A0M3AUR2_9SPHN|nr:hypothetical protein YP76_04695 [Sphingobium chungbukense]
MNSIRNDRVIAMADWLDTIPSEPPFHQQPGFAAFSDLTDSEIVAVQQEMLRRATADENRIQSLSSLSGDEIRRHKPQPIETAPKDGGWILGQVQQEPSDIYRQPWAILTWSDGAEVHDFGWYDDDGNRHEPTRWVPLPDPQPFPTGWSPPCGTIRIEEITGEGWTCNGKPIDVPYRWVVYIEKPDGSYDEYRESWHAATLAEAQARAERWRAKFGLPIVTVPLDKKVIPFKPAVTKQ